MTDAETITKLQGEIKNCDAAIDLNTETMNMLRNTVVDLTAEIKHLRRVIAAKEAQRRAEESLNAANDADHTEDVTEVFPF